MPPKKAAKKQPPPPEGKAHGKKHDGGKHPAGKHEAGKHGGPKHQAKDLRRAYEHLGRLEAVHELLPAEAAGQVEFVTNLAQEFVVAGDARGAAELLRAAEHLSFGALAGQTVEPRLHEELREEITEQFDHLLKKAGHSELTGFGKKPKKAKIAKEPETAGTGLPAIAQAAAEAADIAFDTGAFRRALEYARACEALSHVQAAGMPKLGAGAKRKGGELAG